MLAESYYPYTAYYCEENIWHLANSIQMAQVKVVFISNASRQCALWNQKITQSGVPVVWDYHVVLLAPDQGIWEVYDFDTVLPWGSPMTMYLSQTFDSSVAPIFLPHFRIIPASEFLERFSSDRRHMRDGRGNWLQPIPEWPAITPHSVHNLDQFIAMDETGPGEVIDLQSLRQLPLT